MAGLDGLLGAGSTAEQFMVWGVAYAIAQRVLEPVLAQVAQRMNSLAPEEVLSPADLADQVVRNITDVDTATSEAAKSGVNQERFLSLVQGAGEPPGLEFLLQAFRRGFLAFGPTDVGTPSVIEGIQTSRIYNYWTPIIQQMLTVPISPSDAVNAVLRGQIPLQQGQDEAYASGIDTDRFAILLDSAGRPPSPGELLELLRRQLIPLEGTGPQVTSFQQGIFEGDSKDKWWQLYAALAEYIPPPRTVTALLRTGSIDTAEASQLFQDSGLTPDMAAKYTASAQGEKLAGSKQLAASQVTALYEAQALDQATALAYLAKAGYGPTEAQFVLELSDLARETRALNSAITKVGSLYVSHHITRAGAVSGLQQLKLDQAHIAQLFTTWDTEATINVHQVTPAEVMADVYYGVIPPAEGLQLLQTLGYSARGAWLALASRLHGTTGLGPEPPSAGPGVI